MLGVSANLSPGTVRLLYIHTKKSAQTYIPCVLQGIETTVLVEVVIRRPTEKMFYYRLVSVKDITTRKHCPKATLYIRMNGGQEPATAGNTSAHLCRC